MTHWAGIVIGSGIAGLSAARGLASQGPVLVVSKSQLHTSATEWAQGGIAVVMHHDDRLSYHFDDTIQAGAGLCDPHAVAILVQDGPQRVAELIALGAQFDRDPDGYSLTQEAAHSQRRILHAGDATGREIEKTLGQALLRQPTVTFLAHTTLLSLIIHHGECVGVILADSQTGAHQQVHFSDVVILATGGCGQLYQRNTNPWVATG
ncbi:FAD-dependent oxidoreductase, partial [bacterium]|nr:FAD-dependent oxidoreductase [bacterium]